MQRSVGSFYEFFAGGGMARAGLGGRWRCLFANDFNQKKAATYCRNWGAEHFRCCDVRDITTADLPGVADLVWASFPCQDLSLAGGGAGLKGERSGTFWPFWRLMTELIDESRAPGAIVLENVCGTMSSHGGRDFQAICGALRAGGYRFGALVVDAALFVPQSRPRLLLVATRNGTAVPDGFAVDAPAGAFHPRSLKAAFNRLPAAMRKSWVWWRLPAPPRRNTGFSNLLEEHPTDVSWHTAAETRKLLGMMSEVNREKVRAAKRTGQRVVGTVYKRTRRDETGRGVAACGSAVRRCRGVPPDPGWRVQPPGRHRCREQEGAVEADLQPRDGPPHGPAGQLRAAGQLQRGVPPDGRRRRGAGCPAPGGGRA